MHIFFTLAAFMVVTPDLARAQTIPSILDALSASLGGFVVVGVALALVFFVWGMATFVLRAGNDSELVAARKRMLWGVIGLTLVVSVWGAVEVVRTLVGVPDISTCDKTQIDPATLKPVECI